MKKKTLSLLLMIVMMIGLLGQPLNVSAESMYIRKVISVVYDDSGSMKGDKYAYANYATQAFSGMLNEEDQLFITYMSLSELSSQYRPDEVNLSANQIQGSVDKIRAHYGAGSTPYDAVVTAYNKLLSVKDDNPNTQYWLVIITDGDFNEFSDWQPNKKQRYLDGEMKKYVESTMPNGSHPQITFMGIGDIAKPTEKQDQGIYTYSATNEKEIIDTMSAMADRVSGRTRVAKNDMKQLDDKTIQISSSIPLLNIAVLLQESSAKIEKAVYSNEVEIPIGRKVNLEYPGYSQLLGSAYLLGDSQRVIGAGTYNITFDSPVDVDDVDVLFEPALEMRMTITVNGKEIADYSELQNTHEGDKISVSCKIYEMGTDTEVDPSLMPPGTKFEVSISEDGTVIDMNAGEEMSLDDYTLKNIETELKASLIIDGFNPIEYTEVFTPEPPAVVYTIGAEFGGNTKSIRLDELATNQNMTIEFTIYADGVAMTDENAVKALNPSITFDPQGNDGTVIYQNDGKIIVTPNKAVAPSGDANSFDASVTCTLGNGISESATYTVVLADYKIEPTDAKDTVEKIKFYDNKTGVSFVITKDGKQIGQAEAQTNISVSLNEEHQNLNTKIDVAQDGTITITPYSDEEIVINFKTWWLHWMDYFKLSGKDVVVTLQHPYGSADAVIDVVEASLKHRILNVWLPFGMELLFVILFIAYWIRFFTKARFAKNAVLYVGEIYRDWHGLNIHYMSLRPETLNRFNKFKYLWNPFKELEAVVGGVRITATHGNKIICNEAFPWYVDCISPTVLGGGIDSPEDVVNYCDEHEELPIKQISVTTVSEDMSRVISIDSDIYYFVKADREELRVGATKTIDVIETATVFCYTVL